MYRKSLPPLRSKHFDELEERIAKGDVLTDEEFSRYDEKISAEFEDAQQEAEKTHVSDGWDHFLETHRMRIGDCYSSVLMENLPLYCREKPYEAEVQLKEAMNAALSKKFHKEDGTSSMPKDDDFVKMIIVLSREAYFVMKTEEYAQAVEGLGSIPFKGVNLKVSHTGSLSAWDDLSDEDDV